MYFSFIYFFNLSLVTTSYTYGKPDLLLFSRFIVHKVRLHIFKKRNKVFLFFLVQSKKKGHQKKTDQQEKKKFFPQRMQTIYTLFNSIWNKIIKLSINFILSLIISPIFLLF